MNHELHVHEVRVYYEDTDLTGAVYHANYLRYFERAREHAIGVEELVRLYREEELGFVVTRAELTYREPALHGDTLEILSQAEVQSDYRITFQQRVRRKGEEKILVHGEVEMVCVNKRGELVPLPAASKRLANT